LTTGSGGEEVTAEETEKAVEAEVAVVHAVKISEQEEGRLVVKEVDEEMRSIIINQSIQEKRLSYLLGILMKVNRQMKCLEIFSI
jgi:hypothetical protein